MRLTTAGGCVDPNAVAAAIDECDAALDAMVQVQPIPCGTFLTSWGSAGSGDGQFNALTGVAVDASGDVFVTDTQGLRGPNNRIQKFDPNGILLAKWGSLGSVPGQFNSPSGVAVDGSGSVFVAEYANNRIQKFDPNGIFLAKWGSLGSAAGQFYGPSDIAVDGSGNVFVADTANRIQKFACP